MFAICSATLWFAAIASAGDGLHGGAGAAVAARTVYPRQAKPLPRTGAVKALTARIKICGAVPGTMEGMHQVLTGPQTSLATQLATCSFGALTLDAASSVVVDVDLGCPYPGIKTTSTCFDDVAVPGYTSAREAFTAGRRLSCSGRVRLHMLPPRHLFNSRPPAPPRPSLILSDQREVGCGGL
jgi:hypothetical protein